MKKIIFLMAAATMAGSMMTSCKEDTQPRLEAPTTFVLNTPATANDILILSKTGEGSAVNFTVSQPNYGLGTPTQYEVQLSKTQGFSEMYAIPSIGTQAQITVSGMDMAIGINTLNGIVGEEDESRFVSEAQKVFVRVRAFVPGCAYSEILSNVISIWAKPFFAVAVPAQIYLIGKCETPAAWDINVCTSILDESENGIGSNIFSGVFTIAKGECQFRFYSKLGDWENNSIGTQDADEAMDFKGFPTGVGDTLETDVVVGKAEKEGKGSWNFPDWPGGKLKITVDLSGGDPKAYFEAVELD